jgi:acetyl-CoA carboxylase biotin carboxyl carrier protein
MAFYFDRSRARIGFGMVECRRGKRMALIDVKTEVAGIVWQIVAGAGDAVGEEDTVIILESMKMEIPVSAPVNGTVVEILVAEGETVAEGAVVARMRT